MEIVFTDADICRLEYDMKLKQENTWKKKGKGSGKCFRSLSVLLSLVLFGSFAAWFSFPATAAEKTVQQVNNIVLFAQFDSLETTNFMQDKTEEIIAMCNDDSTYHSLSRYIETISDGQMRVTSYFPQLENGVIQPYVLQKDRSSYTDYNEYAIEMLTNIAVSEEIPLDGDQDGVVDNVTFVVDGRATSVADPLWAKAFSIAGMEINGVPTGSANLHSGYTLLGSKIFNGIGTLCHEFLHSMGYPDLYHRSDVPGNPVGQWDIMSTNSVFLQYPLAYQRYAVSGWMDAQTITQDGTYTMDPASASSGNRLYLLKTPLSETEFFAVEYRKPGKAYSDELDCKIYGEGLVVYRINTAEHGNYRGDQDEIYVFRPDETTLNGGLGDLTRSCYGGTNAPDHIGTTDLEKTFAEDALVYADGTNSGIALDQIQILGDGTLQFTVSFADVSGMQLWETVPDTDAIASANGYDMATDETGALYLFSASENAATLYQADETDHFSAVSIPLSGTIYNPKLVFCGNVPYVLYQDASYLPCLRRWNAQNGTWEACYTGQELAQYTDLATDGKRIFFTYTIGSYPYALYASAYDPESGSTSALGNVIADNACNMEIAVAGGKVLIGYRDLSDGNTPKLSIYDGSAWNTEKLSESGCGTVSVAAEQDTAWILPTGEDNTVFCWKNGTLSSAQLPENMQNRTFQIAAVMKNGQIFAALNGQNPEEFLMYQTASTDSTWKQTGNPITNAIVNSPVLAASGEHLYCLYTASEQSVVLKKLRIADSAKPEPKLSGDVNENGVLDLGDAVLLQRYLLVDAELTQTQAERADVLEDQVLNGLDLTLLKQLLLQKV